MPAPAAVVFYISGHGFGHASREVEVINTLAAHRPDLTIVLRTAVSEALLTRTLRAPVIRLEGPCDTGVIQRDSVTHDDEATVREAAAFQQTMGDRVEAELVRLRPFDVRAIDAAERSSHGQPVAMAGRRGARCAARADARQRLDVRCRMRRARGQRGL